MGLQLVSRTKKLSPLHQAAKDGDLDKVKQLLLKVRSIHRRANSYSRHPALFEAAYYGHLPIVKLLVEHKHAGGRRAVASLRDRSGQTVLHMAAMTGQVKVVEYLLQTVGIVALHKRDRHHCGPLHYAAYFAHASTMRMLILHGAALHAKNGHVATPLQILATASGCFEYQAMDLLYPLVLGGNTNVVDEGDICENGITLSSRSPAQQLLNVGYNERRGFRAHRR